MMLYIVKIVLLLLLRLFIEYMIYNVMYKYIEV